jgi:hypothetical protein
MKIKVILVTNNKLLENKNLLKDNNKNLRLVLGKIKNHNLIKNHSRSQNHNLIKNSLSSSILLQVVVHS